MSKQKGNQPEFSDRQLLAALKRVGLDARQAAFKIGRPVVVFKGKRLIRVYQDGREVEVVVQPPDQPAHAAAHTK